MLNLAVAVIFDPFTLIVRKTVASAGVVLVPVGNDSRDHIAILFAEPLLIRLVQIGLGINMWVRRLTLPLVTKSGHPPGSIAKGAS
ncbi:hypothetical protein A5657_03045 [Mycobacterium kubicae]|nr:hypothetical protein A5657_03045 [Mycobacterium kubicae]